MPFLMNAWYCAGWAHELDDQKLLGRKLLGRHVLMYRKLDGGVVAMNDACPHRFAPLHLGKRTGDTVACPYHGLEFGPNGQCTRNPHGDGKISKACKVDGYPLVERWHALWIWMGDAAKADPALIPDFSMTEPREGRSVVYGYHETEANYQLVIDNLLDRSHVQCMHPHLWQGPNLPPNYEDVRSMEVKGDVIWDYHCQLNSPKFPLMAALWPDAPEFTEQYFDVRWEAPGNILLNSGVTKMGSNRQEGSITPMANLITPADENRTHYFWNMQRNQQVGNAEADQKIKMGVAHTFKNEDGVMVKWCQELMGTHDLFSLNPVLLAGDASAVRARRILAKKIADEQAATAAVATA